MKVRTLAALAALALGPPQLAEAITINDPGVVGTIDINGGGVSTNPNDERGYLNTLLAMANNTTQTVGVLFYSTRTTPPDYSGTATGGVQTDVPENALSAIVPAGSQYVLAKYDAQNAGYIGWYLGGASMSLPLYPFGIWGDNPEQYRISHFTVFGETGGGPTVPDNGVTVALLGLVLLGFGAARRWIRMT